MLILGTCFTATPSGSSVLGVRRRGQVDATSSPSTPDASFSMISGETSSGEDSDDDDFVPDSFVDDDHDVRLCFLSLTCVVQDVVYEQVFLMIFLCADVVRMYLWALRSRM